MKISAVIVLLAFLTVFSLIHLFTRESLEDIKMGSVAVEPGDSLSDVTKKMQKFLYASGSDWVISVDCKALDQRSSSYFGSGGSGLAVAILSRKFGCKCIMLRSQKRLLITEDTP